MPGKKYSSIKNAKAYESIKSDLVKEGTPVQEAKTRAAKISNSKAPPFVKGGGKAPAKGKK